MSASAKISVVIPAYNAAPFIEKAVRSVLDQTWTDLECIVVDDGSTDDTAAVLSGIDDPRLRTIHQPNSGVSRARNAGVAASSGELVAFLDSDDAWLPRKLERQVAVLAARPEVGAVLCSYLVTDTALEPIGLVPSSDPVRRISRWLLLEGDGPSFPSTVLLRRSCFDAVNGFDPAVDLSADLLFAVRLSKHSTIEAVEEPLSLYRTHDRQMNRDLSVLERNMLKVYADVLGGESQLHLRRRGTANLYTRLFFHDLRVGDVRDAIRCLRRVLSLEPARLGLLPLQVGGRRARDRLGRMLRGCPQPPGDAGQAAGDSSEVGEAR